VPEPLITKSDQIKVRVQATSICGTDYHIWSWDRWSAGRVKPPRIMGHEFAGEIVEIGPDVTSLKVGDYVSGESHWTCGHCRQCLLNERHVCCQHQNPGGRCGRLLCALCGGAAGQCLEKRPFRAALSGLHTGPARQCRPCDPGRRGDRPHCSGIGLRSHRHFAVAVARAAGASAVYATDTKDYRLDLATQLGAAATVNVTRDDIETFVAERTDGQGVDVVLEMSGAPSAIVEAMRICRRGGRVSLMGIPAQTVELDMAEDMIFKGLTVQCIGRPPSL